MNRIATPVRIPLAASIPMMTDEEGKNMGAKAAKNLELEIDLTAQRLLAPLGAQPTKEPEPETIEYSLDETSEIELTAQQMDDMLAGRWNP